MGATHTDAAAEKQIMRELGLIKRSDHSPRVKVSGSGYPECNGIYMGKRVTDTPPPAWFRTGWRQKNWNSMIDGSSKWYYEKKLFPLGGPGGAFLYKAGDSKKWNLFVTPDGVHRPGFGYTAKILTLEDENRPPQQGWQHDLVVELVGQI